MILAWGAASAMAVCVGGTAFAARPAPSAFVPGELLVKFNQPAASSGVASLVAAQGARVLRHFKRSGVTHLAVQGDTLAAAAAFARNPLVAYAEPNYLQYVSATPNDPQYSGLWGMNNTGQTGGTPDADIDAAEAWDLATGNGQVVVGVIDTGVDVDHPDLAGNLWTNAVEAAGTAGVDDDGNGYVDDLHGINAITGTGNPDDDHGHGTHCSGTIGAVGNDGVGVVGVNWDVQILGCKFLNSGGSGNTADAIECVEYTTDVGVDLTSNSWGGGGFSQALQDAIGAADTAGILFVAAAGNAGQNNDSIPNYPSNYPNPNVIAVAATDHNDAMASFSSYGATTVDVAAPGVNILSTWFGGGYNTISGTSMATPHVAGLAALLWSASPALPHSIVKDVILTTVDPLGLPVLSGGRINAQGALLGLCDPTPIADAGPDHTICPGDGATIGTAALPDTTYSWSPGGATTPQLAVSPAVTTTYTVTATTSCGSRNDSVTVYVADSAGLDTDFEGGLAGWTASGLWHAAANSTCAAPQPGYSSPVTSAYYGQDATCNYDVGTTSGSLTSPPIYGIDAASTLTFDYLRQVESFAGAFDVTAAQVLTNGGSTATTVFSLDSSTPSSPVWTSSGSIPLAAFAGQSIQVRFSFTSGDDVGNAFIGWMVDDVEVTGTLQCGGEECTDGDGDGYGSPGSAECTFPETDCDDGDADVNPGAAEVCNGVDDDCDVSVDEDFDVDGDGYTTCGGDCDDGNPGANPGAIEICGNGTDDDCDTVIDEGVDADGDGFTTCGGDCDDGNANVNPGEVEQRFNGIDDDCNPSTPTNPNCQSVATGAGSIEALGTFATGVLPAMVALVFVRRARRIRRLEG